MASHDSLIEAEDYLLTRMGKWFPGQRVVFRGADLHSELGAIDWVELFTFSVSGRRFTREQVRLFNALFIYSSFPDPRLWNNRVMALSGTARSTGSLALGAALAVSEAEIYGGGPTLRAHLLNLRLAEQIEQGEDLERLLRKELREHRVLPGFGRPLTGTDERVVHLLARIEALSTAQGRHLQLALAAERCLLKLRYRLKLNYAGLVAAVMADIGVTPRQFQLAGLLGFVAGMIPCYLEAQEKPEGAFFPLRCTRIAYEGCSRRTWSED